MLHKSFDLVDVKTDAQTGTFEATVAVFGNVDSVGDRIVPGAFTKTLARWQAAGDPVPVILSHQSADIMAHVGYAMPADMRQSAKGLFVKGTLDIADNPVARQVHKLMKQRRLKEFSFGYKVPRGGEKRAHDGANDLTEIDLIEVGPTLKGANSETELHSVKAMMDPVAAEQTAEAGTEEGEQDTLETVLELLSDFLDTEDDAPDIAAARDIMRRVQALLAAEGSETDAKALRRSSGAIEREQQAKQLVEGPEPRLEEARQAVLALEAFDPIEVQGVHDSLLKAAWTAAHVNTLPDASFLYIEPGAGKDAEGKTTPRSARHFPYRDTEGKVDLPHLRNALARIPQSNLSPAIKDQLTARAQRILESQKSDAAATDKETIGSRSADPLRNRSLATVLEIQSDGMSLRKSPPVPEPAVAESLSEVELRRRSRDLMLAILTGTEQ